jgi:hypothetical protein
MSSIFDPASYPKEDVCPCGKWVGRGRLDGTPCPCGDVIWGDDDDGSPLPPPVSGSGRIFESLHAKSPYLFRRFVREMARAQILVGNTRGPKLEPPTPRRRRGRRLR